MKKVKITTEFIKLDQFLKWVGLCSSGTEAKILIKDGKIKVNGEIEERRGRKLYSKDIVKYESEEFELE